MSPEDSTPAVSVVLPTRNRAHTLPRAIGSVLAQSFGDLELIVVDDGSTDGTAEFVRGLADSRVVYLRRDKSSGAAAARNAGLAAARGAFVAFQDSDDEWLLDKLAQQVARLDGLRADFAGTQAAILRHEGASPRLLLWDLVPGTERRAVLPINNTLFLQGLLARRAALLEVGGFDERLCLWEDWELMIRVCQRFRVDIDARPVALVYDTPGSVINKEASKRVQMLTLIVERHQQLLQECPEALAINLYAVGWFLLLEGESSKGRGFLLRSLAIQPLRLKTWAMLALSLLGHSAIVAAIAWRNRTRTSASGA